MKRITIFLLSFITVFSMMAQPQMTGPRVTLDAFRATNAAPLLYSQMIPGPGSAYASQEFPDYSNCRVQSADDFMVPAGGWTIALVEALGPVAYADPSSTFIVEIFADNVGLPGTLLHSQTGLTFTETSGVISIPLASDIQLTPGHYWISIMVYQDNSLYGQWFWQSQAAPQILNEFANQDPCNLVGWPPTWGPGSTTIGGLASYDLCFALYGTPAIPLSNWAIILGVFLIAAFTVYRIRRRRLA